MDRSGAGPHHDAFQALNSDGPLGGKLERTHEVMRSHFPFLARIAVATYDPGSGVLSAFAHSSGDGEDPLAHYRARLTEAPSLARILDERRPRVINSLVTFEDDAPEHAVRLGRHGYVASYTMPMFYNDVFFGFVFFNSRERDVFTEEVLRQLDVFGHMIALLVINELSAARTLLAAVRTTIHITHQRDPETGSHLDRMSRYARLIATALADAHDLDDEFIEHVFMFSPLHDIGKIAIPDSILLKPGKLEAGERAVMNTHARKGREIIDELVENFGLDTLQHVDMLRNIAEFHHEAIDGHGYPSGRSGKQIPLEARIVAVADVFDALTSRRPYKEPWNIDEAFAALERLAGEQLDRDCVQALIARREEVERIRERYQESS